MIELQNLLMGSIKIVLYKSKERCNSSRRVVEERSGCFILGLRVDQELENIQFIVI